MRILCSMSVSAAVLCVTLLCGCGDSGSGDGSVDPDEAFLEQVRRSAESATSAGRGTGRIQPGNRVAKLELETTDYVMAEISYKGLGHGEIKVYNRGTGNLEVDRITTTCDCTVGAMRDRVIPPGGSSILEITIDPARIHGFYTTKVLTLYTNDLLNPFASISVTTYIEPEAEFSPDKFLLGIRSQSETVEMVIRVRQLHEKPLEIFSVGFPQESPYFTVKFAKVPESEWKTPGMQEYIITGRLLPGAPEGEYLKVISVKSNLEYQPEIGLPIYLTIVP